MAAEQRTLDPPPLSHPGSVLRHATRSMVREPLYRRVVAANIVFFGVFLLVQFVLPVPRLMEPLIAILLYVPLAVGQWRFWRWGDLDTKTAVAFVQMHRKAFKDDDALEKLERPDVMRGAHFRVQMERPMTFKRAAFRATYVYGISLALGAMFSTMFLPSNAGTQYSAANLAGRSSAVFLFTAVCSFGLAWVLAPIWLIEEAGVRYYSRRMQTVERVSRWFLNQLGPFLGVGAVGTFFIVYYITGFTFLDAIIALLQFSLSLYPAALTTTFLYQRFREGQAVAAVKDQLQALGVAEHGTVTGALLKVAQ